MKRNHIKTCTVVCILVFIEVIIVKICKQLSVHGQIDGWINKRKYIVMHMWVYIHMCKRKIQLQKRGRSSSVCETLDAAKGYPKWNKPDLVKQILYWSHLYVNLQQCDVQKQSIEWQFPEVYRWGNIGQSFTYRVREFWRYNVHRGDYS